MRKGMNEEEEDEDKLADMNDVDRRPRAPWMILKCAIKYLALLAYM